MKTDQVNKLVWIIKTLESRELSLSELNERWIKCNVDEGNELPRRTFFRYIENIATTFNIFIKCKKTGRYVYYISNPNQLKRLDLTNWLVDTISISRSLLESKTISDKIILEENASSSEYLDSILQAIKTGHYIHISYYNFWRADIREHYIMPLCVKLFRQRWYVVGRHLNNVTLVYAIDRIRDIRESSHTFEYPDDFDPEYFFEGFYGVMVDTNVKIETVRLKVSSRQANYMRSLPMMPGQHGQKELERNSDYSIFQIRVRPTSDFIQDLFWHNEELEVLSPQWLRDEIKGKIQRMLEKYK